MKKIRNFRLRLHFKETRRRARRKFDLPKMGLDDAGWANLLTEVESRLKPAVSYETFRADSEETVQLTSIPGLAHTLGLATLGPGLATLIEEASDDRKELYGLVAVCALDQAVQFVVQLLKKDTEAERCELSPIQYVTDAEPLRTLYERLEGAKIDLSLSGDALHPEHSAAFCVSWISKPRRGRGKAKAPSGTKRKTR